MAANPVTSWLRSSVYYTDIKKQQTTKPDNTKQTFKKERDYEGIQGNRGFDEVLRRSLPGSHVRRQIKQKGERL